MSMTTNLPLGLYYDHFDNDLILVIADTDGSGNKLNCNGVDMKNGKLMRSNECVEWKYISIEDLYTILTKAMREAKL